MRHLLETIGGMWALLMLAARTRFRLRGSYWRWRMETAFGSDRTKWPPRRERFHAILDYARWVHRMRKRSRP